MTEQSHTAVSEPPRPEEMYWSAIPEVQVRDNLRSTGKADIGWHVYCASLLARERRGTARMLFLGAGWLERDLYRRQTFSSGDVIDPSPEAVQSGRSIVANEGIRAISYSIGDAGSAALAPNAYDAVWSEGALGRISDLEHAAAQIAGALRPDGLLFAREYVGPSRYAMPRRQREAIQAAFSLVPARFRRRLGRPDGEIVQEVVLPPVDGLPGDDPALPVRSSDVVSELRRHFDLLECRAAGGTILQFLLYGIAGNFRSSDRASMAVLDMLFGIEDALIDSGELGSDYVLIVARPKQR